MICTRWFFGMARSVEDCIKRGQKNPRVLLSNKELIEDTI